GHKPDREIDDRLRECDPHDVAFDKAVESVANDISRITVVSDMALKVGILQKQPTHVRPEQVDERTVRVWPLIRPVMMHAMGGNPPRRRILDAPDRQD